MASSSAAGYLVFLSLKGCGGCQTFVRSVEPAMLQSLPDDLNYSKIEVSKFSEVASGYERLFANRPRTEFPMLAWSQEPPAQAKNFSYLAVPEIGKPAKIISWLDALMPQQPPPVQPVFTFAPTNSSFAPSNTSLPPSASLFDKYY